MTRLERNWRSVALARRYAASMSTATSTGPDFKPAPGGGLILVPRWSVPAHVKACMSTRTGGFSSAPWNSLNLGDHVGDDPEHVQVNRARWQQTLGRRPVYLSQVHGTHSVVLSEASVDGQQADVCECADASVAATIMVADCMPVLMTDARGQWVAAGHAGWRGLAGHQGQGVLEVMVHAARARGIVAHELHAWLGPCIGPTAFEVGDEVRQIFVHQSQGASTCFVPSPTQGKWLADLSGLARLRLRQLNVQAIDGNDGGPGWCTFTQSSVFFSHRRDTRLFGSSGRMAASIWLTKA